MESSTITICVPVVAGEVILVHCCHSYKVSVLKKKKVLCCLFPQVDLRVSKKEKKNPQHLNQQSVHSGGSLGMLQGSNLGPMSEQEQASVQSAPVTQ